nr:MAG TPA: CARDB protein [Caudoviricetes sp.]
MSTSIKVITPANLGKGIEFNPATNQWEAKSGFDCSSIDQLPERPWKKGTTLLAKQDGQCVRLSSFDTFFQEIGVGITASRTNGFTGEEYRVVVTVTNTGEGANELTNLNISKPEGLGVAYDIKDLETLKVQVDEIERVDDFTYNIKNTKKGGTAIIRFTVVPKALGNYQFTAMVNPNSALDKDLGNNTSTIVLNAQTKTDANLEVSEECPIVELTDVATGTVLGQAHTDVSNVGGKKTKRRIATRWGKLGGPGSVFYVDRGSQGLQLRLSHPATIISAASPFNTRYYNNAETVYIKSGFKSYVSDFIIDSDKDSAQTSLEHNAIFKIGASSNNVNEVTDLTVAENAQDITINGDYRSITLLVKPRGKNCALQGWVICFSKPSDPKSISLTNVQGGTVSKVSRVVEKTSDYTSIIRADKSLYQTIPETPDASFLSNPTETLVSVLKVKAGTAASATINWNGLPPLKTSGLVTITDNGVTVSANASSADSVRSQYLDVIIND